MKLQNYRHCSFSQTELLDVISGSDQQDDPALKATSLFRNQLLNPGLPSTTSAGKQMPQSTGKPMDANAPVILQSDPMVRGLF